MFCSPTPCFDPESSPSAPRHCARPHLQPWWRATRQAAPALRRCRQIDARSGRTEALVKSYRSTGQILSKHWSIGQITASGAPELSEEPHYAVVVGLLYYARAALWTYERFVVAGRQGRYADAPLELTAADKATALHWLEIGARQPPDDQQPDAHGTPPTQVAPSPSDILQILLPPTHSAHPAQPPLTRRNSMAALTQASWNLQHSSSSAPTTIYEDKNSARATAAQAPASAPFRGRQATDTHLGDDNALRIPRDGPSWPDDASQPTRRRSWVC